MSWHFLPLAARVKCAGWPAIWLPLVLLWPLIFLALFMGILLCAFVPTSRGSAVETARAAYRVLCALRGTSVEFGDGPRSTWTFTLY